MRLLAAVLVLSSLYSPPAAARKTRAVHIPSGNPGFVVTPVPSHFITDLAFGPGGSVWFGGDAIGRLASDGTVQIVMDARCGPLVVLADSTVWCKTTAPDELVESMRRVRPDGTFTDFPVRASAGIFDVVATSDGNVMFSESRQDRLGRITASGTIEELDLPPSLGGPGAMTIGSDGALWFAARRAVARVIADNVYEEYAADALFAGRSAHSRFTSIAAAPDGTLRLAIPTESRTSGRTKGGAIVRLTPDGTFTEVLALPFFHTAGSLAAGPDGSLWFIDRDEAPLGKHELVRMRPDGALERYGAPPPMGAHAASMTAVVVDASGLVTVAANYATGKAVLAQLRPR